MLLQWLALSYSLLLYFTSLGMYHISANIAFKNIFPCKYYRKCENSVASLQPCRKRWRTYNNIKIYSIITAIHCLNLKNKRLIPKKQYTWQTLPPKARLLSRYTPENSPYLDKFYRDTSPLPDRRSYCDMWLSSHAVDKTEYFNPFRSHYMIYQLSVKG